jgi:hypothetical protein
MYDVLMCYLLIAILTTVLAQWTEHLFIAQEVTSLTPAQNKHLSTCNICLYWLYKKNIINIPYLESITQALLVLTLS